MPGLGLLGTRAHRLGVAILAVVVVGSGILGFAILRDPLMAAGNILASGSIQGIGIALAVAGLCWVAVIIGTYLISRPRKMTRQQRAIGAAVVGVMSLLVSAPTAVGTAYSLQTANLSGGLFQSEDDSQSQTRPSLEVGRRDPWANKERVNLLLLGGDSGAGRDIDLGVRTDTMMLASIDTRTGATLIIQLPRNLQGAPFPAGSPLAAQFPYGFDNGGDSMLSAVWNDVPNMLPDMFTDTDYPGADALKWAVEGVTALKVDYFVLVNIDGLVNLVDAMGGVRLNVNFPIAKGGSTDAYNCGEEGWIPEGPNQLLNGTDAMWYARSRCNSPNADYSRMQRQSCLVNAVIDQADPAGMAVRYEAIAKATGDMVSTDIPQEHLSAMVELAKRVQNARFVQRITFIDGENGYWSAYPDFDLMASQISAALVAMSAPPATEPATSEPTQPAGEAPPAEVPVTDPAAPAQPSASASQNPVEDVTDACAYRHEEPLEGVLIPDTVPIYTPPPTEPAKTP